MDRDPLRVFKSMHLWCLGMVVLFQTALSSTSPLPVCILGAGPSGITTANELEAVNRSTVIFEKEDVIGGKARNYYEDGFFYPLGPFLLYNGTYTETLKLIADLGLNYTAMIDAKQYVFDWKTGATVPGPSLESSIPVDELERYTKQWKSDYEPYANSYENLPDDLTVSIAEWLSKNNYPAIQSYLTQFLAVLGYGDAETIPAIYPLQPFSPEVFTSGEFFLDYLELFHRYFKKLKRTQLHLSSTIEQIDRSENNVTIHYHTKAQGSSQTQSCSDLIIAFAPTANALKDTGIQLTPSESQVFSAVEVDNYFSGVFSLDIPPTDKLQVASASPKIAPEGAGEPLSIDALYNETNIFLTWAWATGDQTPDEVKSTVIESLGKINKDPSDITAKSTPLAEDDVKDFEHFPNYFPHFNSTVLREGWYDKLEKLQGEKRTYYISGLNKFEAVEYVVRAAKDLVKGHF
ncbi:hypothetical protein ASPWEDRAFT_43466 [Aspergillus wentii DTO 134E9]|uniref:Amine oxidase domain-containing protein n=1 Tax=Aspergillus wentii DTO 134E9 TaxID=1073089 RepID=A0A1L9REP7_ASPWE|nr:uncharacterized protein ASPWEDRAFT_43466 [Aspergillus wentii DTO 134E9]KAI9933654.1 hypothetical protein MW887_008127 [Aspergillus wentii]OJJ33406.1 hypothetical protein ASPWEDRAFT_43466 [Aspergillus wentii DTO 134E9]